VCSNVLCVSISPRSPRPADGLAVVVNDIVLLLQNLAKYYKHLRQRTTMGARGYEIDAADPVNQQPVDALKPRFHGKQFRGKGANSERSA